MVPLPQGVVAWNANRETQAYILPNGSSEWEYLTDPPVRKGAANVGLGGSILLGMGRDGDTMTNEIHIFDQEWRESSPNFSFSARSNAWAFRVSDSEVVFFGGLNYEGIDDRYSGKVNTLNDGAIFDLRDDSWSPISGDNPLLDPGIPNQSAGALGEARLFVWGSDAITSLSSGAIYDLESRSWSKISSVGAPSPRHHHAAFYALGDFFVQGGSGFDDLWRYDPDDDVWSRIATKNSGASGVALPGDRLLLTGGNCGSGVIYDPSEDSTVTLTLNSGLLVSTRQISGQEGVWFFAGLDHSEEDDRIHFLKL